MEGQVLALNGPPRMSVQRPLRAKQISGRKAATSVVGPMVSKKSKIEELRKSRESRIFDVFTAARLCRTDSAVRGRFCVKRFGP